ncbi:interleukin-2 receptor subunit alpha [Myotis myotis]|uniref:Interleukin-2 receptor subunit alpha n=1 Tax=Myotis myotis TaxID=51298 RepID=A0A7J8AKY0_MYOMY|nr:interleukin-2 receptor subunit alpha [Myotis myotis]KAF6387064.1 interleukin 2 receptor subunit alpha [Myotis myotis]
MKSSLLMWRFFTFIMVTDCVTEFCYPSPPNLRHATFKAITYEMGTLINCDCKTGFRRSSETIFMNCTGNAGHSAWENQCQCKMNSLRNTQKQATPKPEEQKERKATEMQSQTQPTDQVNLGHCKEPPPWEHEASKRIYHFVVGQTVHYKCAQGFRAEQKGPATSTCKMICGKTRWTQPQLKCTSESENDQFLDDEEFPAITDIPSGSEASCPFTTTSIPTDFQKPTEVSTTTEMFIFTTEYQIAVAGCILLLISIFLLSVLTWQRRRRKSRRTL